MKKILKIIIIIILSITILVGTIFGIFTYKGYSLYKSAIAKESIESKVESMRSQSWYVVTDDVPYYFKSAVIAVEDHRFESHGAIDPIAILRAIWVNISQLRLVEGGSTITQQVAKNMFFTQKQNFERKLAEIFLSFDLEELYSKNEILELYINDNYYGDGYYGIGGASRGYFEKEPMELTFDEMTLLAGLPNAPSIYSLSDNSSLARQRQTKVINSMVKYGYITEEEKTELLEIQSSGAFPND